MATLDTAMAHLSKLTGDLPEGYGYVILTGVGNLFLNMWMAINVGKARKKYEVMYPLMYHPEPNHIFNCIQRVHQNTCEANPMFMFLLLTGGLQYPKSCAVAGVVYIAARVAFAFGYYTGDPAKRNWGAFGHLADLVLIGSTVSLALDQLQVWPFNN